MMLQDILKRPELKILADTFIDLEERSDIIGNKLNFAGRIVDFFTYEGIEGLEVHVSFEGMDLVETVVSEEDGKLYKEIEIEVPEDYPYYKNFFLQEDICCFTVLNLRN